MDDPRLYGELASWWPLLSAPEDYEEEAGIYIRAFMEACDARPTTLLELGSGGGNNASHMKRSFEDVVLVDRSAGMLDVSRRLNPECRHVQGDMRSVRLGRQFDCVFIHDAVCYITTEDDLRQVMETALVHCVPGGVALFAPDFVTETFRLSTDHGGHDGADRGMRYLEWTWDPDPSDTTYVVDFAYLLREADGSTRVVQDRHLEGLFPRSTWLRLLEKVGFSPRAVEIQFSDVEWPTEMFVAKLPHSPREPRLPNRSSREP